jgi:hypothetical protein
MDTSQDPTTNLPEPFITLGAAAKVLGIPVFKMRRAANDGIIPVYTVHNQRRLCRLTEIIAVIQASRRGGAQ